LDGRLALRLTNVEHDSKSYDHFPAERLVGIGGKRRTGESYQSQEARSDTIYAARPEVWARF
jgi:hypothetical protein